MLGTWFLHLLALYVLNVEAQIASFPVITPNCSNLPANLRKRDSNELLIGVNLIRVYKTVEAQFGPTAQYLTDTVGRLFNKTFRAVPASASDLYVLPKCHAVDFLYVNPCGAVCEELEFNAKPLATQISYNFFSVNPGIVEKRETVYSGGGIYVLADSPYHKLTDLKGARVTVGSLLILGGLPQLYHSRRSGFDFLVNARSVTITQENRLSLLDLLEGKTDAALLASFTIHHLFELGVIKNISMFRKLDEVYSPDKGVSVSGDTVYSEFAFMSFPHVPRALEAAITAALLDIQTQKPEAAAAGMMTGWAPPLDYSIGTDMFIYMGLMDRDARRCVWHRGASIAESYPLIQCPAGYWKKSIADLTRSCNGIIDCPFGQPVTDFIPNTTLTRNYACLCSPCVEVGEELTIRMGVRQNLVLRQGGDQAYTYSICTSKKKDEVGAVCATPSGLRDELQFEIIDNLAVPRQTGQLDLKPIGNFTIKIIDGSSQSIDLTPFQLTRTEDDAYVWNSANSTILSRGVGLHILQIFRDGVEITQSPVLFTILPVKCGGRGRKPNAYGQCVCGRGFYELDGKCRVFDAGRLAGLVVGCVLALLLCIYFIKTLLRVRGYASIIIAPADVYTPQPVTVVGTRLDGRPIVLGIYRAQEVALKTLTIPNKKLEKYYMAATSSKRRLNLFSSFYQGRERGPSNRWEGSYHSTATLNSSVHSGEQISVAAGGGDIFRVENHALPPVEEKHETKGLVARELSATVQSSVNPQGRAPLLLPKLPMPDTGNKASTSFEASSNDNARPLFQRIKQRLSLVSKSTDVTETSTASTEGIFGKLLLNLFFENGGFMLPTDLVRRVSIISGIRNRNVLTVHGVVPGREPVIVQEHLSGCLLDFIRNETVEIDDEMALKIGRDIASGLSGLHAAHVVHGALRTRSILLDSDLNAKVSGFAFGKTLKRTMLRIMETPYTAPEVLRGHRPTAASDVYAFAIILYEIVTRREAYEGEGSPTDVIEQVMNPLVNKRPKLTDSISVPLKELLRACWSSDPAARPTARELVTTLSQLLQAGIAVKKARRKRTRSLDVNHLRDFRDQFPPKIQEMLNRGLKPSPEKYEHTTIFCADIVGWTSLCSTMTPEESVDLLERLYGGFDKLCTRWGLFKMEVIGDAFIAISGIPNFVADHARRAAMFALEARSYACVVPVKASDPEGPCVKIRIGMHSGPVVGSVVGSRRRKFSVYGDTMNIASRMEGLAEHGSIHMSDVTARLIELQSPPGMFDILNRGIQQVKGRGQMQTFNLLGLSHEYSRGQIALGVKFLPPYRLLEIINSDSGGTSHGGGERGNDGVLFVGGIYTHEGDEKIPEEGSEPSSAATYSKEDVSVRGGRVVGLVNRRASTMRTIHIPKSNPVDDLIQPPTSASTRSTALNIPLPQSPPAAPAEQGTNSTANEKP